jgi:methyltransferase
MASLIFFTILVALVACERLVELRVSQRNAAWSFARGGQEYGQGHYKYMVVLHTALLVGCVAEAWIFQRSFIAELFFPMLILAVLAQGLRWWVIGTLGHQWNTRIIVVPSLPPVRTGPYRWPWLRHPNYIAVVVEGIALPLIMGCWITALVFTILNAFVLTARIREENKALATLASS